MKDFGPKRLPGWNPRAQGQVHATVDKLQKLGANIHSVTHDGRVLLRLYHGTQKKNAVLIANSNVMMPGTEGAVTGGIYF